MCLVKLIDAPRILLIAVLSSFFSSSRTPLIKLKVSFSFQRESAISFSAKDTATELAHSLHDLCELGRPFCTVRKCGVKKVKTIGDMMNSS